MFLVDELQNPARYGLVSTARAAAAIRFAREAESGKSVVSADIAVTATERTENDSIEAEPPRTSLTVDLIPGSNRLVTTITDNEDGAILFQIPAWWTGSENSAEDPAGATYL